MQSDYEKILEPKMLRDNLALISLYIAAFEFTKDIIISKPKDFFMIGFENGEEQISPKYKEAVLSLNRSPLYASLEWFKGYSAISQDDFDMFNNAKELRNETVHNMMHIIYAGLSDEYKKSFDFLQYLLRKIERWWFSEIEMGINPEYDGKEIDVDSVEPVSALFIDMMYEVALGDEDERDKLYREFMKQFTQHAKEGCR